MTARSQVARPGIEHRLALVVSTITGAEPPIGRAQLWAAFEAAVGEGDPSTIWLALAVLHAALPTDAEVVAARRRVRLDGARRAFAVNRRLGHGPLAWSRRRLRVEVIHEAVLVDLHHTSRTSLATGIQRVARQSAARWDSTQDVVLVGWDPGYHALRRLGPKERQVALHGGPTSADTPRHDTVLVPWRSTVLLPELATEAPRSERLLALAKHSGSRTGAIGFDCVPLTSAETIARGMGAAFSLTLAAVRHMDRVATISRAAATEYGGWRTMLAGTGLPGPQIAPVLLPVQAEPADPKQVERLRAELLSGGVPLVLCVGSHEPRKNHLAVLQAAELCWRAGLEFTLLFVGGNSWAAQEFHSRTQELVARGRPIELASAWPDERLWAAYRLARCVVFPSLNEGFGLPVAEALACGTPAITSRFGSMAEIAAGGGALLVDPRDDDDLASALARLIRDDVLRGDLAAAAAARPARTWAQYADEVWQYLVQVPRT